MATENNLKDSFIIQFVVRLWLKSAGVTGPFGAFVSFFVTRILGDLLKREIIIIDIKIDKWKEALKDPEWKEAAKIAYDSAMAKVYTQEEKLKIRKQYEKALSDYATFGNGMPDNQNP